MTTNLYQAHRQWAIRPKDERFGSLEDLYNFTLSKKQNSTQRVQTLETISLETNENRDLIVNGNSPKSTISNWAFGQLGCLAGAPASYLRTIPPELAIACLQYGLKHSGRKTKILYREDPGNSNRFASAFTGPKYGRIWDADILENLIPSIENSAWHVPPARANNESQNSGLYASDHDMFVFFVNDEKPVEIGNAKLGRGFFCWNSETGSSTFGLTTFLYNYICGNHIVWGAEQVEELKIIHRANAPSHFYSQALPALNKYVGDKSIDNNVLTTVDKALCHKIGNTLDNALDWFKPKPFTKQEVINAWDTGIKEGEDVTNVWGMVQGLTAYARNLPFCDKKVNLERRAGGLLKLAAA